ncbi:MAG: phosphatase PAP2 family protein [Actinobacteria bacterium]|nr:phosphatase PAP2 family protein [Actinomycetota bacterium]
MDSSIYRSVNHLSRRTPWLHPAAVCFAKYGIGLFALALLVAWWQGRRESDPAIVARAVSTGLAVFAALGATQLLGHVVERARPYDMMPSAQVLISRTTDFSFPSDHATAAGAVAMGLWFVGRRLGLIAVALAVLMALARVYVGAHYPSDVVAGLLVGAGTVIGVNRLLNPGVTRLVSDLNGTPLRLVISANK